MNEIGEIIAYTKTAAPRGFLICDGSAVSRQTYSKLFTSIGETYGAGDGVTTFNLPNLKGRLAVGYDGGDSDFNSPGKTGGANTASTSHSHTQTAHTHSISGTTGTGATKAGYGGASATSDANHTHTFSMTSSAASNSGTDTQGSTTQDILNPYVALTFLIRHSISNSEGSFIFMALKSARK